MSRPRPRRAARCAAAVVLAGTVGGAGASAALAAPAPSAVPLGGSSPQLPDLDVRRPATDADRARLAGTAAGVAAGPAVSALRAEIGPGATVDIDPATLTPRQVARSEGVLTGPSSAPPAQVALDYVRRHSGVFRLADADLAGLRLARDYVDLTGIAHLSWVQQVDGVRLFGGGLEAHVAPDGRLLSVQGSPLPGLRAPAAARRLSRGDAVRTARTDLRLPAASPARDDTAAPVVFATAQGPRAAYQVVAMSAPQPAVQVVDAETGVVLYRRSLVADAVAPGTASVFRSYPGATRGGEQQPVDLTARGWLPAGSGVLAGNNVHTYTDVDADNVADPSEEVGPAADGTYRFPQRRFDPVGAQPCDVHVCTWRPGLPWSWQTNRQQTATQTFFLVNQFHDHLQAAPIGFTEAAGNFQQVNRTGRGLGGDAVQAEPLDGASTADGLPDGDHVDNATFATPPDGTAPRMQMFLFHRPGTTYPSGDPFLATSGADDAGIVFHEYAHGLSSRLVVDPGGNSVLHSHQGSAMGEGWSDWYALDLLVARGHLADGPGADLVVGRSVLADRGLRTQPIDCAVGATGPACPGTPDAGPGGYTYGDVGRISPVGPEPHGDGEIWAQTLWDLRSSVGVATSESLVTRAMELSPAFPSFLDMRDAVLLADRVTRGGADRAAIWNVFARRGMGYTATTVDGDDDRPVESFALPPGVARVP